MLFITFLRNMLCTVCYFWFWLVYVYNKVMTCKFYTWCRDLEGARYSVDWLPMPNVMDRCPFVQNSSWDGQNFVLGSTTNFLTHDFVFEYLANYRTITKSISYLVHHFREILWLSSSHGNVGFRTETVLFQQCTARMFFPVSELAAA